MVFDVKQTGYKIRLLRETRNWSQKRTGKELNLSGSYIGKLERGGGIASIGVYVAIARLFDVSVDYLLIAQPGSRGEAGEKIKKAVSILKEVDHEL